MVNTFLSLLILLLSSLQLLTRVLSHTTEFADVTENVFKLAGPVLAALKDANIQRYFRSLSVRFLLLLGFLLSTNHNRSSIQQLDISQIYRF